MQFYQGHKEYIKGTERESKKVSKISYGCMNLGGSWDDTPYGKVELDNTIRVLETCVELGINFFDHADIYTRGKSELVFGEAMRSLGVKREDIFIQSKCGIVRPNVSDQTPYYNFSYQHIKAVVEGSLSRLGTEYLDVLLLHRPDALVEPEEVARAFSELNSEGKVRAFGVSNFSAPQLALMQKNLPFKLVYNQMQISAYHHEIISSGLEYNTPNPVHVHFDILDYCRYHDVRLQAWGPVASGKLLYNPSSKETKTALQSILEDIAQRRSSTPTAVAVAWLLRHPAGIQPILGTIKPERIREMLESLEIKLDYEEWYDIVAAGRGRILP